jgi:hypothetical protein
MGRRHILPIAGISVMPQVLAIPSVAPKIIVESIAVQRGRLVS